jgi:hypothetical protein
MSKVSNLIIGHSEVGGAVQDFTPCSLSWPHSSTIGDPFSPETHHPHTNVCSEWRSHYPLFVARRTRLSFTLQTRTPPSYPSHCSTNPINPKTFSPPRVHLLILRIHSDHRPLTTSPLTSSPCTHGIRMRHEQMKGRLSTSWSAGGCSITNGRQRSEPPQEQ